MARPKIKDRDSIRSERISLALTPASYQAISTLAQIQGVSVNDLVASLLEAVIKKNLSVIEKFNAAIKDARADLTLEGEYYV